MNKAHISPQKEFDPYPLLNVILEGKRPAESATAASDLISSIEIKKAIWEHSGEEVPLLVINDYMTNKGFGLTTTNSLELLWMVKK